MIYLAIAIIIVEIQILMLASNVKFHSKILKALMYKDFSKLINKITSKISKKK